MKKMDLIKKILPKTYYADRGSEERIKLFVEHWRRLVKVNQELEEKVSRVELPVIQPALHYCEYNEPKTVCGVTFAPHRVKTIKSNSVSRRCIVDDIEITNMREDLDTISCLPCREWLKERLYHCPEHGFISGADVTFDEHCAYCGEAV